MTSLSNLYKTGIYMKDSLLSDQNNKSTLNMKTDAESPINAHQVKKNIKISRINMKSTMSQSEHSKREPSEEINQKGRNKFSNLVLQKTKQPSKKKVLDKLEETYWSQWKPNKQEVLLEAAKLIKSSNANTQSSIIGGDNHKYNFLSLYDHSNSDTQECRIDESSKINKIDEHIDEDETKNKLLIKEEEDEEKDDDEVKMLKHTDSFILNSKKQLEEKGKPRYQQPKCIRLYKNSFSSIYVRGGSYPLKSCLKKGSTSGGKVRRPLSGSPYWCNSIKPVRKTTKLTIS